MWRNHKGLNFKTKIKLQLNAKRYIQGINCAYKTDYRFFLNVSYYHINFSSDITLKLSSRKDAHANPSFTLWVMNACPFYQANKQQVDLVSLNQTLTLQHFHSKQIIFHSFSSLCHSYILNQLHSSITTGINILRCVSLLSPASVVLSFYFCFKVDKFTVRKLYDLPLFSFNFLFIIRKKKKKIELLILIYAFTH